MRTTIATLLSCLLIPTAVHATQSKAVLEVMAGEVFVDNGSGLTKVKTSIEISPKDQILLKTGGAALLARTDGSCVISLRQDGLYSAPDMTDCHAGQATVLNVNYVITPANGVYTAVPQEAVYGEPQAGNGVFAGLGFGAAAISLTVGYSMILDKDEPVSGH